MVCAQIGSRSANVTTGLSVVIPCLNECETIARAVARARAAIASTGLPGEVIVADNGSSDGSVELAQVAGARIVAVQRRGYGEALHAGISQARFTYVGFADADLSYPFDEMARLLEPLHTDRADFVLGSRLRGLIEPGAMPFLNRYLGTPVLSKCIGLVTGLWTSDCNSGMRVFRRDLYATLDLRCRGMEYASEMLIRVAACDLRFHEVPIVFHRDQRGKPPHLRRWRDGFRHLRYIVSCIPQFWLRAAR